MYNVVMYTQTADSRQVPGPVLVTAQTQTVSPALYTVQSVQCNVYRSCVSRRSPGGAVPVRVVLTELILTLGVGSILEEWSIALDISL